VLCDIALCGYRAIRIDGCSGELHKAVEECDVILNTVPSVIFSEGVIRGITNKPLYVEIASSPGGIDVSAACDVGIRTIFAPSLPGKYSPISAGKYIFETISDILSKGGIEE
jgi:dipicolinate synthase subunit A